MILSFELPFALIPLLKFTSCKSKMGEYANSIAVRNLIVHSYLFYKFLCMVDQMTDFVIFRLQISTTTWIIGSLIMGINIFYLAEKLVDTLRHSNLNVAGIVFCGFLGVLAMLVYLASIAYLVLRKNKQGSHLIALSERPDMATPREDIASMQLPQRKTDLD